MPAFGDYPVYLSLYIPIYPVTPQMLLRAQNARPFSTSKQVLLNCSACPNFSAASLEKRLLLRGSLHVVGSTLALFLLTSS